MFVPTKPALNGKSAMQIVTSCIVVFAGAVVAVPTVHSCGFDSPVEASRGFLNWTYPNALYVRTAVWQAEDARILPPRPPKPATDMFAFQRVSAALRKFGERINAIGLDAEARPSFSIVLINSVLWTRFMYSPDGYGVEVHADGPTAGDVVIVTDGKVIRALVEGFLTPKAAKENGLIRFYGASHDVTLVDAAVAGIPAPKSTDNAQMSAGG